MCFLLCGRFLPFCLGILIYPKALCLSFEILKHLRGLWAVKPWTRGRTLPGDPSLWSQISLKVMTSPLCKLQLWGIGISDACHLNPRKLWYTDSLTSIIYRPRMGRCDCFHLLQNSDLFVLNYRECNGLGLQPEMFGGTVNFLLER